MRDLKYVTWRNLKSGDIVEEWREGNLISCCHATVVSVNPAYVTLSIFDKYDKQLNSETTIFGITLTEEEYHTKYLEAAKEIVKALHNKIADYEAGYHEMWNAWINHDPYTMAKACKENNMKIIGYVDLLVPKTSFFGEVLDVGICCEYLTGERFWCHTMRSTIEYIQKKYSYLLEGENNG